MTDLPVMFFVLNGLINGEKGVPAIKAGPSNGPAMKDGWYFHRHDGDTDGVGPYASVEEAREVIARYTRITTSGLILMGIMFTTLTKDDRMTYAGAGPHALIAHMGDTDLLWDPDTQTIEEHIPGDLSITEEGETCRRWEFTVMT